MIEIFDIQWAKDKRAEVEREKRNEDYCNILSHKEVRELGCIRNCIYSAVQDEKKALTWYADCNKESGDKIARVLRRAGYTVSRGIYFEVRRPYQAKKYIMTVSGWDND